MIRGVREEGEKGKSGKLQRRRKGGREGGTEDLGSTGVFFLVLVIELFLCVI